MIFEESDHLIVLSPSLPPCNVIPPPRAVWLLGVSDLPTNIFLSVTSNSVLFTIVVSPLNIAVPDIVTSPSKKELPSKCNLYDGLVLLIPILPEESIRKASFIDVPLFVENIKSPFVSSEVPSCDAWICAKDVSEWSLKIILVSAPPSVFSSVVFVKVK